MTCYEHETDIFGEDEKLVARKLKVDRNREKCVICDAKENLYDMEYDITEHVFIHYGIYCADCVRRIFKIK